MFCEDFNINSTITNGSAEYYPPPDGAVYNINTEVNSTYRVICDTGYLPSHNNTATCIINQTRTDPVWTSEPPSCSKQWFYQYI